MSVPGPERPRPAVQHSVAIRGVADMLLVSIKRSCMKEFGTSRRQGLLRLDARCSNPCVRRAGTAGLEKMPGIYGQAPALVAPPEPQSPPPPPALMLKPSLPGLTPNCSKPVRCLLRCMSPEVAHHVGRCGAATHRFRVSYRGRCRRRRVFPCHHGLNPCSLNISAGARHPGSPGLGPSRAMFHAMRPAR